MIAQLGQGIPHRQTVLRILHLNLQLDVHGTHWDVQTGTVVRHFDNVRVQSPDVGEQRCQLSGLIGQRGAVE